MQISPSSFYNYDTIITVTPTKKNKGENQLDKFDKLDKRQIIEAITKKVYKRLHLFLILC